MGQSARITSVEAVRDFRSALAVFCEDARQALSEIDIEARRLCEWVSHEQTARWRRAVRDRQEELTQAKQALFRKQLARISGEIPDCTEEKKEVRRMQEHVRQAEEKLENCRRWDRQLPQALDDYAGPSRQLAARVEGAPPRPVIFLGATLDRIEAYIALQAPGLAGAARREPAGTAPASSDEPQPTSATTEEPERRGVSPPVSANP